MNSKHILIFFVFLFSLLFVEKSHSQSEIPKDSVNQFDNNGKKDGVWIEYISEYFCPAKKKGKATYFRYVTYQHGEQFYTSILKYNFISKKQNRIVTPFQIDSINKPVILNGTFYFYDAKKQTIFMTCIFKNGWLEKMIGYDVNGIYVAMEMDYLEKYNGIESSYLLTYYNEKREITNQTYGILENSKWRTVRIK